MTLRIGLVGAGSMGALHARVIATNLATELAWVADPNPAAETVAARFGAPWREAPDFDSVDAVVIATPTSSHVPLALGAIDAGLPVLVEKPLAETYAEATEMVMAAARANVVLMCGFVERFNPALRTLGDIVHDPIHVSAVRHSPYAERVHTGVMADLLIHDVDLVIRLFGEPPSGVMGSRGFFDSRSHPGREDVVEATMSFGRGQIATISTSRLAQRKVRMFRAVELGREIDVDLLRQSITIYRHVNESLFDEDAGYRQQTIIEIPVVRHVGEPLQLQLDHFVDLIRGEADAAVELASLLPPHEVMHRLALSPPVVSAAS